MMDLSVVPYEPKKPQTLAVRSPPTTGGDLASPSRYRECMRNHAASLGGRALDGCGEFMPSSSDDPLTCAACGCHRNFHRREASPPPPALVGFPALFSPATPRSYGGGRSRKRIRTKFTAEQKEKMQIFAEKIGWRMPRQGEVVAMEEFCEEVGVKRHVMKVWMHNNKNHLSSPSSVAASVGVENGGGGSGQLAEGIGV